jgi:hypothetical protein
VITSPDTVLFGRRRAQAAASIPPGDPGDPDRMDSLDPLVVVVPTPIPEG